MKQLTTKEQAQLLVDKFNFSCRECDNAILSAQIAVDTIIQSDCLHYPEDRLFWKSVMKELDGLKQQELKNK
jgi:hypothetical protein